MDTTKVAIAGIVAAVVVIVIWLLRDRIKKLALNIYEGTGTVETEDKDAIARLKAAKLGKKTQINVEGGGATLDADRLQTGEEVKVNVKKQ